MNYKILIAISFITGIFTACKPEDQKQETATTFVLSDKMLKTTTTAVASKQAVKNELSFYGKITTDDNNSIDVYQEDIHL